MYNWDSFKKINVPDSYRIYREGSAYIIGAPSPIHL